MREKVESSLYTLHCTDVQLGIAPSPPFTAVSGDS